MGVWGRENLFTEKVSRPRIFSLFHDGGALDDDGLHGHVLVIAAAAGLDGRDLVHHVLAADDLAEHGIAPALRVLAAVVEEAVVPDVDEELGRGRVRVGRAGHGDGVLAVAQAVVGFVLDGGAGALFAQAGGHAAALDHEVLDDAVEDGAVVLAGLDVFQEVGRGHGGLAGVQTHEDVAHAGLQLDHGVRALGADVLGGGQQGAGQQQDGQQTGEERGFLHEEFSLMICGTMPVPQAHGSMCRRERQGKGLPGTCHTDGARDRDEPAAAGGRSPGGAEKPGLTGPVRRERDAAVMPSAGHSARPEGCGAPVPWAGP